MRKNTRPAGRVNDGLPPLAQAREWLEHITPRPQQQRAEVAFALFDGWGDVAEGLFLEWLSGHPEHNAHRARGGQATWRSARRSGGITWRKLRHLAWAGGWRPDPAAPRPPPPSAAELARQQAEREARAAAERAERQRRADAAAVDAAHRYAAADPASSEHAYLVRKCLSLPADADLRQEGSVLLVPLRRIADDAIRGLELILPDGRKLVSKGTDRAGCCWWADLPPTGHYGAIFIAEGFATALTVAAATGAPTAAAGPVGNLLSVTLAVRERWPAAEIVIAADADEAGRAAAAKAAAASGARVVVPVFAPGRGA